jgi:hypothetical protein
MRTETGLNDCMTSLEHHTLYQLHCRHITISTPPTSSHHLTFAPSHFQIPSLDANWPRRVAVVLHAMDSTMPAAEAWPRRCPTCDSHNTRKDGCRLHIWLQVMLVYMLGHVIDNHYNLNIMSTTFVYLPLRCLRVPKLPNTEVVSLRELRLLAPFFSDWLTAPPAAIVGFNQGR